MSDDARAAGRARADGGRHRSRLGDDGANAVRTHRSDRRPGETFGEEALALSERVQQGENFRIDQTLGVRSCDLVLIG